MKGGSRDQFLHRALTDGARLQGRIGKFLHTLKFMVTVQAAVFIDGHSYLSSKGVGMAYLV
jgi:hypothetical protein